MERQLFGFLVLSGLCSFLSSLEPRQFHFINQPKTWLEAQQYCRENHKDLATVNDMEDLAKLAALIDFSIPYAFLGLYRSWGWSRTDNDDYKEGELSYWNWASGQPNTHYCVSITKTGEWFATDCKISLQFFCYDGITTDISQRFTLGNGSKNWPDAQAYCRKHHTDLARVRDQPENEALQQTVNNGSFWIGLTWMSWLWSDGTQPSFTPWNKLPSGHGDCALLARSSPVQLKEGSCNETYPFLCYSGQRRKHLMRLELITKDASVDMQDPAVIESVLTWVKKMLQDRGASADVNLSWWKRPRKEQDTPEQTKTLETNDAKCLP